MVELARERKFDVGVRQQPELDGGVAEAQVFFALKAHNARGAFECKPPCFDQNVADRAIGLGKDALGGGGNEVVCSHGSSLSPLKRGLAIGDRKRALLAGWSDDPQHGQLQHFGEVVGRADTPVENLEHQRCTDTEEGAQEDG